MTDLTTMGGGSGLYDGEAFLRQLSGKEDMGSSSSKRWSKKGKPMGGVEMRKRVMVVVDHSTTAKTAVMWALTHVANKGDHLTLLEVVSPHNRRQRKSLTTESPAPLASSQIASLCKACRPEVMPSIDRSKKSHVWKEITILLIIL